MKVRSLLAAVVLLLAGCSASGNAAPASPRPSDLNDQTGSGKYDGVGLIPPLPRPQFTLDTTAGKPYPFGQRTAGRTTLLFFGYTRCPDVCPQTMADTGVALRSLPTAVQRKVTVVFVTTDVKHDTGPVIASWLAKFSPGTKATFVGLRGTQAQVDAAQAASHVMLAEDNGKTHSSEVLLYGPDDYAHVQFIYNNSNEAKQMAHDVRLIASS
ncbi:MAG TPA: SCO family protein [Jatrophihabitantaceae bacterium]|jgi:protein SCO1/2